MADMSEERVLRAVEDGLETASLLRVALEDALPNLVDALTKKGITRPEIQAIFLDFVREIQSRGVSENLSTESSALRVDQVCDYSQSFVREAAYYNAHFCNDQRTTDRLFELFDNSPGLGAFDGAAPLLRRMVIRAPLEGVLTLNLLRDALDPEAPFSQHLAEREKHYRGWFTDNIRAAGVLTERIEDFFTRCQARCRPPEEQRLMDFLEKWKEELIGNVLDVMEVGSAFALSLVGNGVAGYITHVRFPRFGRAQDAIEEDLQNVHTILQPANHLTRTGGYSGRYIVLPVSSYLPDVGEFLNYFDRYWQTLNAALDPVKGNPTAHRTSDVIELKNAFRVVCRDQATSRGQARIGFHSNAPEFQDFFLRVDLDPKRGVTSDFSGISYDRVLDIMTDLERLKFPSVTYDEIVDPDGNIKKSRKERGDRISLMRIPGEVSTAEKAALVASVAGGFSTAGQSRKIFPVSYHFREELRGQDFRKHFATIVRQFRSMLRRTI